MVEERKELIKLESGEAEQPFRWSAGVYGSRFLAELRDNKRFVGVRCPSCGKVYVPPRNVCGPCFVELTELVPVSDEGEIITYTVVSFATLGWVAHAFTNSDAVDLPGSGEARLSREDFVQFRPRCQRTPCHAVVVGVDASGNARVYLGGEASAGSVLLGDEHPPGVVTVHAVFSEAPFREEEVAGLARALAAGERISTRGEHVTGILVIDP